jgi:hypothetical protein
MRFSICVITRKGLLVQTLILIPLALVAAVTLAGVWMGIRGVLAALARRPGVPCGVTGADSQTPRPEEQVEAWARERRCAMCDAALGEGSVKGHHVALLAPGGGTREWTSIDPAGLPLALATCLPVCWNCHVAETFRRMHPELITERDASVVCLPQQTGSSR